MKSYWLKRLKELAVRFNCEDGLGLLKSEELLGSYIYLVRSAEN